MRAQSARAPACIVALSGARITGIPQVLYLVRDLLWTTPLPVCWPGRWPAVQIACHFLREHWPLQAVRVGEATNPGPESSPLRRRVRGKSCPAASDLVCPNASGSQNGALPAAPGPPIAAMETPTRFWIERSNEEQPWAAKGGWLVPTYKAETQCWTWQISTAPRWSSSTRPTASSALQHFMDAHGPKLPEEARETIRTHIEALKQNLNDRVPRPPPAEDTPVLAPEGPRQATSELEASLLSHERILEVLHAPVRTCRHIPSDSLAAITRLFRAQLGDDRASELIFILPKLIWPAGPHGENPKTKAKRIANNLGLALGGQWATLADQALGLSCWKSREPGHEGHPTVVTNAERLVHAAKNGRPVAKTWNQLRVGAPLCTQPEQWSEARQLLQPHHATPITADQRGAVPGGPEVTSWPIIQRLKQQRAPDLGGWTHEALQQIMRTKQNCGALDLWLNRIIGQLPLNHALRELLWHHKATLLGKRPTGVRPILIGSVFQKVAAKAFCELLRPLVPARLLRMQYPCKP